MRPSRAAPDSNRQPRARPPHMLCALSSDGIPFLMHDEHLSRTTNVASVFPARVRDHSSDFSWAELKRLNAGAWFLEVSMASGQSLPPAGALGAEFTLDKPLLSPVQAGGREFCSLCPGSRPPLLFINPG